METKDELILGLDQELKSIKKSFEVLLLAIEAEGVIAASEIAERLMGRLEKLMADIKSAYVEVIFERRFRVLAEDHQRLAEMKSGSSASSDQFIQLVGRIEKHISNVDRELRLLVPRKPPALRWIRANWRKLAIGAASVALVIAGGAGLRSYMTRGKGLIGEYYDGTNFRKVLETRRDLKIDFDLNGRGPVRGVGQDNFSVRWTGTLRIPSNGEYEFITRSDDGVRLWIDNELLIDNWTVHRAYTDKAIKKLKAGHYPIRLEWFQRRGPALLKLYWRMANDAQPRLIEPDYLIPN